MINFEDSDLIISDVSDDKEQIKNKNILILYEWIKENEPNVNVLEKKYPIEEFDSHITFDEEPHLYTVYGMIHRSSMTSIIHSFFEHFDEDATIERMLRSKRWSSDPRYRYYQKTKEEIKEEWEFIRKDASLRGTIMHASIEYYYNGLVHPLIKTPDLLGLEYQYFYVFDLVEVRNKLEPFRTELRVFDLDYEICGSVDMLFRKKNRAKDGSEDYDLIMYDWKRSKKIDNKAFSPNDFGKGPVHGLPNCNKYTYFLQLNGYKYLIEKNTKYRVTEMYLGVFHPNHGTTESRTARSKEEFTTPENIPPYLKIQVPDLQRQVATMFELRRHNLIMEGIKKIHTIINSTELTKELQEEFIKEWRHLHRLGKRACKYVHTEESTQLETDIVKMMDYVILLNSANIFDHVHKSVNNDIWRKMKYFWKRKIKDQLESISFSVNSDSFKYVVYNTTGLGV